MATSRNGVWDNVGSDRLQQSQKPDSWVHEAESNQERITNPIVPKKISKDTYNWRKYHQRNFHGNDWSYYGCVTHPHCRARKRLVHSHDGQITDIRYDGVHNQPKPHPILKDVQEERLDVGSIIDPEDHSSNARGRTELTDAFSTVTSDADLDGAVSGPNRIVNYVEDPEPKGQEKEKETIHSADNTKVGEGEATKSIQVEVEVVAVESGSSRNKRGLTELAMADGLFLKRTGMGLIEPPNDGEWEKAVEVHLVNSELSKLSENPRCPKLSTLMLQGNYNLRTIPSSFFEHMPALQVLNLSKTGITSLPESLFRLIGLKEFYLNDSEFLMVLSPEVGELKHLEVLDLEGTEIIDLPKEIEKLTQLRCLKVSFYGYVKCGTGKSEHSNAMIPHQVISALYKLRELSIDVNPDDERWHIIVEDIVKEVCCLWRLRTLKFYFPKVELLGQLNWNYEELSQFRIIAGHHVKRIISRFPFDVESELKQWGRCLSYVYGEGVPEEIKKVLRNAVAFHLDRHMTVKNLSEFGLENMRRLKCCILGECNEIEVIVDGDIPKETGSVYKRITLESLEYLNIYYMKNLSSIWEGPVLPRSFSHLKSLTLRTCPKLATIFTLGLLGALNNFLELTVEDCPAIKSLVSWETLAKHDLLSFKSDFLPSLKKVSLHFMCELVSLSSGVCIARKLEWMSIYNCPKLRSLSLGEASTKNLKKIKGEREWWQALKWESSRPDYLDAIFVPIKTPIDIVEDKAA